MSLQLNVCLDAQMCTCLYLCLCYLKAKWVEAGVCLAANWSVSLNLHGIQQVLVAEAGRPADLELSSLNTAGTSVMELESVGGERKKGIVMSSVLLVGPK